MSISATGTRCTADSGAGAEAGIFKMMLEAVNEQGGPPAGVQMIDSTKGLVAATANALRQVA